MIPHYVLDGTKIGYHMDRLRAWERGERIAPVTVDWAVTTNCNYHCQFCAAAYQTGQRAVMSRRVAQRTLADMAEIGVKGVVFMSDGENTMHPNFAELVKDAHDYGLSVACATNGFRVNERMAAKILPYMDYLRINFSAGEPRRYAEIMGVPETAYWKVVDNVIAMVDLKRKHGWPVTLNLQMVCRPQDADQIIQFTELGKELGVDYAIIKHCLDYQGSPMHVDYAQYDRISGLIRQAEAMTTAKYLVTAKWSKMLAGKGRSYKRCYGPPFLLQISGTGLVAACGPLFAEEYKDKFHIGNVNEMRLKNIWKSDRYWRVMDYLRSDEFDTARDCGGFGCVQDGLNRALDGHLNGRPISEEKGAVAHKNFI